MREPLLSGCKECPLRCEEVRPHPALALMASVAVNDSWSEREAGYKVQTVQGGAEAKASRCTSPGEFCLSVCPRRLPPRSLIPHRALPCPWREPSRNQGGDSLRVTGSGHCCVSLQLKSKWDESIFTKGCIQALESWLPRNIYIVAGVFIAISLLQVCPHRLCGFLSCRVTTPVPLSRISHGERRWWLGVPEAGSE